MTTFYVLYEAPPEHPGKILVKEWAVTELDGQVRLLEGASHLCDTYAAAEGSLPSTAIIVPPPPAEYTNVTTYVVP